MASDNDFSITSLRGGQNDTVPPNLLAEDECVLAENVEFYHSTMGERRNGCGPLDLGASGLNAEEIIVHLSQWFPVNNVLAPEFWGMGVTPGTSATLSRRDGSTGVWSEIVPVDAFDLTTPAIYQVVTRSLNGLNFVAYKSSVDRLHVWDQYAGLPGILRRTGLPQAAPPTVATQGSGSFNQTRYYRIRWVREGGQVAPGQVVFRSEPSTTVTFNPPGTGAGATVTRPSVPTDETITNWDVEASLNNADFYRIQTIPIATTTFVDTQAAVIGYAAEGFLSDDIGENLNIPSVKFLGVDSDRLLVGGHFTDQSLQSTVAFTPVTNAPGTGNSERLAASMNNALSLDNNDGGPLTGITDAVAGTWYAFKWDHIYKMSRTGDNITPYEVITISKTRGAIEGSIVQGMDENGAPCTYFLDPRVGPSRIGSGGLQAIVGLQKTWSRINLQASAAVARGVYYADKQQLHWWLSVDGADRPNFKIVAQVTEFRPKSGQAGGNAVGRGWSVATGRIAEAACAAIFTEVVSINGVTQLSDRPFIGLTAPDFIQRCDVEDTDAGVAYTATIRTRPYFLTGLLTQWGAMNAALLAASNATKNLVIKFIRDYGTESNPITTDLAAAGSEEFVTKQFDNLHMSEAIAIQVEFTDP